MTITHMNNTDVATTRAQPTRDDEGVATGQEQSRFDSVEAGIELLALDLDGTILDDRFHISMRVLDELRKAEQQGVRVTIATGRPVEVTRPFVQAVRVNAPAICLQGGLIYDFETERTLHELTLPHELGCELIALERQYRAWQAVTYAAGALYVSSIRYDRSFYGGLLGTSLQVREDPCLALDGHDPQKVLFIVPPEDAENALIVLRALVAARATVVQSHAWFVEVNPRGAEKGAGLARLAQDLGIARGQVMAIGDQDNDASMVAWAGIGVAMGNGSAACKTVANWIAPPIDQDGAAVAIERFILSRKR